MSSASEISIRTMDIDSTFVRLERKKGVSNLSFRRRIDNLSETAVKESGFRDD